MKQKNLPAIVLFILLSFAFSPLPSVYAMDEVVIVIDPGHGGSGITDTANLGAGYHGIYEKDFTLITALALKEELSSYHNVKVYLTRESDKHITLKERAAFASSVNADMFVSIHFNASEEHTFFGSEVWTSAFGSYYAEGYSLGELVLSKLEYFGFANKGVKTRIGKRGTDYYGIIRENVENKIPAIIIEHGYLDEDRDWNRLKSKDDLEKMGRLDAGAIASYYGLEKGTAKEAVEPMLTVSIPSQTVRPDTTPPEEVTVTLSSYDEASKTARFYIEAIDSESKLMYYSYSLDDGMSFHSLSRFEGKNSCPAVIPLPQGYSGNIIFKVYNNYDLGTLSNSIFVEASANGITEETLPWLKVDFSDKNTAQNNLPAENQISIPLWGILTLTVLSIILICLILRFLVLLRSFNFKK